MAPYAHYPAFRRIVFCPLNGILSDEDNIAALIVHREGGHTRAVPVDSIPPPPLDLFAQAGDREAEHLLGPGRT
ncbi:MAG: hypothetical protein ABJB12_10325 [Pseudomonadota bacterium]